MTYREVLRSFDFGSALTLDQATKMQGGEIMPTVASIIIAIGVVAASLLVTASALPPPCRCGAGAGHCVVLDGRGNRICTYPNGKKCSFSGPGENC